MLASNAWKPWGKKLAKGEGPRGWNPYYQNPL
jgi:hypothetical protein